MFGKNFQPIKKLQENYNEQQYILHLEATETS